MKKKIYIFGTGQGKAYIDRCLIWENVDVLGFIDNYKAGIVSEIEGVPVVKQNELEADYEYIIISLMQYEDVKDSLVQQNVKISKIICFFDLKDADKVEYWEIFDSYKWRTDLIWKHYRSVTVPFIDNLDYEFYSTSPAVQKSCPKILDAEHTIKLICTQKKCLARFGDNEFELMNGRLRTNYQDVDWKLRDRLREVICSESDNLLVAIADNYGSLERYTDEAARDIRAYLSKEVRQEHMQLLSADRQYYDAYLSRPYMIYRDKKGAAERFRQIRWIWQDKEVLVVEGEHTRFGVGNDLLENAVDISRILVPDKNAFSSYDSILKKVLAYGREKLILAILGPTAAVLAYDLAKENYWAIDIGQLDVEYEWYLRGAEKRCLIPGKSVSEVVQYGDIGLKDGGKCLKKYQYEIIEKIL